MIPLFAAPMSIRDADEVAAVLKIVADPARLRLLSLIAAADTEGATVAELTEAMWVRQPTVSHHLKILARAGLIRRDSADRPPAGGFGVVVNRLNRDACTALAGLLTARPAKRRAAKDGPR